MKHNALHIAAIPLRLALKNTIRHNAATRSTGESIWVQARRRETAGYGEGCPRIYVTGENLESSLGWVRDNCAGNRLDFTTPDELKRWVFLNAQAIDRYPSAWCAVEMALLDLLARESGCSVEKLLGVNEQSRFGRYTAVLGDDSTGRFAGLVDRYLIGGLRDFKIKLNGNVQHDLDKLETVATLSEQHLAHSPRIRLDANNLWINRLDDAIAGTRKLGIHRLFAMEEPVGARHVEDISNFSTATGLPVILDESLCTLDDLELFKGVPGQFIANIKVSRLGGLVRSLRMVEEVKKLGWPIIVGCHVGETSLLTRAALVVAAAAGENLTAHEGAFGDYLMEVDPARPMLRFGHGGLLDLCSPYHVTTVRGQEIIPVENWQRGFGMQCSMPFVPGEDDSQICTLDMPDGYRIHYRLQGPASGKDVLLMLHDDLGHSGWLAPLARHLRLMSPDLTVVSPDRRGSGLNGQQGDPGSLHAMSDDVLRHIAYLKESFDRVHLAGCGQGAQCAVLAGERAGSDLSSLVLLAPSLFWNDRMDCAFCLAEKNSQSMIARFKLQPDHTHARIPLPFEPADVTSVDEWLDFIERDHLKNLFVPLKSLGIMEEIRELSRSALLNNKNPLLVVLGEEDRMVDNDKVRQLINPLCHGTDRNRLVSLDGGHALYFEKTGEVASEIIAFIETV